MFIGECRQTLVSLESFGILLEVVYRFWLALMIFVGVADVSQCRQALDSMESFGILPICGVVWAVCNCVVVTEPSIFVLQQFHVAH